jgi:hypothetical protein
MIFDRNGSVLLMFTFCKIPLFEITSFIHDLSRLPPLAVVDYKMVQL